MASTPAVVSPELHVDNADDSSIDLWPASLLCPVTHAPFVDPVSDRNGNTYERSAILEWLRAGNTTSPITRLPISEAELIPNRTVADLVDEYKRHRNIIPMSSKASTVPSTLKALQQSQHLKSHGAPNIYGPQEPCRLTAKIISTTEEQNTNDALVHVSLLPPTGTEQTPSDIVAVIDCSGSMSSSACLQTHDGETVESQGLSLLDITKHALNTITTVLGPNSRLGLVSYSTQANKLCPLTRMTPSGKQLAKHHIQALTPDGQTNLWDGLLCALEDIRNRPERDKRQATVMILTDGLPNIVPPRGHIPMLQRYFQKYPEFSCTIQTFGFGYSIDSSLLNEISKFSGGVYSFVPDAGFVGTCFVNSLSNILSRYETNVNLDISVPLGTEIRLLSGEIQRNSVYIGNVQCGQTRDYIFSCRGENVNDIKFKLSLDNRKSVETQTGPADLQDKVDARVHMIRMEFSNELNTIKKLMDNGQVEKANSVLTGFVEKTRKFADVTSHPHVEAILQDAEGQVTQAISTEKWYKKWGGHYLLALSCAHMHQFCANFKDPGLQVYGGELFSSIRDDADDAFVSLPPPKPSNTLHTQNTSSTFYRGSNLSMASYYDRSGGCVSGDCNVELASGEKRQASKIRKDDLVACGNGKYARVTAVVETKMFQKCRLVHFPGGLKITQWHPIKRNISAKWEFPAMSVDGKIFNCDKISVFTFVLDKEHTMLINGFIYATLGHGFDGPVIGHNFLGTNLVIDCLRKFSSWPRGHITLTPECFVRNCKSNKIESIIENVVEHGGAAC